MDTLIAVNKKLIGHLGVVNSIATTNGGPFFATGANRHQGVEGNVRLWNTSNGEQAAEIVTELNSIFGLAISPDGCFLAVGGGGAVFGLQWEYTGGVEVWDLQNRQRVTRFGEKELFFVTSIAFSPGGKLLLTSSSPKPPQRPGNNYKHIRLWVTSGYKEVSSLGEQEANIAGACFSPDGKLVTFAANPASIGTRTPKGLFGFLRRQSFASALLRKKNTVMLHDASSITPFIGIWNIASRHNQQPTLDLPRGRVEGLASSPDGHRLASCGSNLITWDFEGRQVIREFAQETPSRCVGFSPSGRILASGGGYRREPGSPYEDCGVRLWDSENGRLIAFLPHEKPVHSLAFLLDGQRIVAGGESGELLLWDIGSLSSPRTV